MVLVLYQMTFLFFYGGGMKQKRFMCGLSFFFCILIFANVLCYTVLVRMALFFLFFSERADGSYSV